jgi:hypothetical protein
MSQIFTAPDPNPTHCHPCVDRAPPVSQPRTHTPRVARSTLPAYRIQSPSISFLFPRTPPGTSSNDSQFPNSEPGAAQAVAMAAKCAAATDLPSVCPHKRARLGWDVAPATEVNAPLLTRPIRCNLSKWFYDTSTGAATGAVPLWFFCWRGSDRSRSWLSGNTVDTKIYVVRATGA